ncbi:hypothetical protein SERLADRAFT_363916 [Serpula lacrymans var. lacrymans S7.9]|uniref:Uncharacterized protein n=1 Tax=Serpula lacrymans var. lacrymans (strain S7.9) TaxID=578457 RepID=F8PB79_SERL9|nr:uncharacterized protein SERLADRAFT_363916 [Serpula lacrymans var. lacrymans S7.9]EGO19519.1 hypothetical protein SERLADRAFT_363916 [Serpula lacrymans var. lacrymans S7.9]
MARDTQPYADSEFNFLSPNIQRSGFGSPASAVFDLPVQASSNPTRDQFQSGVEATHSNAPFETHTIVLDNGVNQKSPSFLVISGGTGGNSICNSFGQACYVLPVSDDGGSSSEIIRVLGGPSIGDVRSRLVRLIPSSPPSTTLDAIRALLSYRLPNDIPEREARAEWRDIVEGRSSLWHGIPNDRKETIRETLLFLSLGFLVYFENEVLKRAHKNFSFLNGSIGNYFLAGAQGFFRSLPSAIFLFSSITNSQANILPVVVTNHTVTIAAELEDGSKLVGQCEISHPVVSSSALDNTAFEPERYSSIDGMGEIISRPQNAAFNPQDKSRTYEALSSRISRLYYINAYGHEVHPSPNPEYIKNIYSSDVLVYSCGSLWTSIIPCLALRDVASAIARSNLRAKVLLLNSNNDRETDGYTAVDYVRAIASTLNSHYHVKRYGLGNAYTIYPISAFITHLVYLKGTRVVVDEQAITALGVKCILVNDRTDGSDSGSPPQYNAATVKQALDRIIQ